jgi:hypothetical protein
LSSSLLLPPLQPLSPVRSRLVISRPLCLSPSSLAPRADNPNQLQRRAVTAPASLNGVLQRVLQRKTKCMHSPRTVKALERRRRVRVGTRAARSEVWERGAAAAARWMHGVGARGAVCTRATGRPQVRLITFACSAAELRSRAGGSRHGAQEDAEEGSTASGASAHPALVSSGPGRRGPSLVADNTVARRMCAVCIAHRTREACGFPCHRGRAVVQLRARVRIHPEGRRTLGRRP